MVEPSQPKVERELGGIPAQAPMESAAETTPHAHLSIGLRDVRTTEEPYLGKPNVRFCEGMLSRHIDDKMHSTRLRR